MRPGRPDFPPLEQPSGRRARRLRLNCSEIRTRLRLAHPPADITFASGNCRQDRKLLIFRTVFEDLPPRLTIGDPVCRDRCAWQEKYLGYCQAKSAERRVGKQSIS